MKKDNTNLVECLYNNNTLWLVLGILISADTYICHKEEAIKRYNSSISTFNHLLVDSKNANIPQEIKDKVEKYCLSGINTLEKELKELEQK